MDTLDGLLTELERLSNLAVEQASAANLADAMDTIALRSKAVVKLKATLAEAGRVSYTEWNRLAIIHYQGNRAQEQMLGIRARLASELMGSVHHQALLDCVSGVVAVTTPSRLNERG